MGHVGGTNHCFRTPQATTILFNSEILVSSGDNYHQPLFSCPLACSVHTPSSTSFFGRYHQLIPAQKGSLSLSSLPLLMIRSSFSLEVHHILMTYLILPLHQSWSRSWVRLTISSVLLVLHRRQTYLLDCSLVFVTRLRLYFSLRLRFGDCFRFRLSLGFHLRFRFRFRLGFRWFRFFLFISLSSLPPSS
jgi:hypothetical protein